MTMDLWGFQNHGIDPDKSKTQDNRIPTKNGGATGPHVID